MPELHVSAYGWVVFTYLALQLLFSQLEHRRWRRLRGGGRVPPVTVVLPSFNEEQESLRAGIRSILAQDYPGVIQLIVVDDGSDAPPTAAGLGLDGAGHVRRQADLILLPSNRGKRHAQRAAFERAIGQYIVTVDDDTTLAPDAVSRLVDAMESDPRIGAASGSIRVRDRRALLALLIDLRYWAANHLERAAQSYFGVMHCCSGPLSVYRADFIHRVSDAYTSQRFLGRACTYGDDRHLTNLALREGYHTRFVPSATARTACPTTIRTWMRQQARWSKSFYRECWWSLRFVHRRNVYFGYNLLVGALLPFLLLYGMLCAGSHVLCGERLLAARYAGTVAAMAWVRGLCGLALTGEPRFLLMPLYGFLHLLVVIPVRIYGLFTLADTRWGTRRARYPEGSTVRQASRGTGDVGAAWIRAGHLPSRSRTWGGVIGMPWTRMRATSITMAMLAAVVVFGCWRGGWGQRATSVRLAARVSSAATGAPVAAGDTLAIDDFESDEDRWMPSLPRVQHPVKQGRFAGLWADLAGDTCHKYFGAHRDWSAFGRLEFWCHSQKATGARFMVVLFSENQQTEGPDYFYHPITVDWEGWKLLRIPFYWFRANRKPVGWDAIDCVALYSAGYRDCITVPGTVLAFDDMRLGSESPGGDALIGDFEAGHEPSAWRGWTRDTGVFHGGTASGRWDVDERATSVECGRAPLDWSGYDALEFWLRTSSPAAGQLTVVITSNDPDTKRTGYFYRSVAPAADDWQHVVLPLRAFEASGEPAGWQKVSRLEFRAQLGPQKLNPCTLRIDDVFLSHRYIRTEDLGWIPAEGRAETTRVQGALESGPGVPPTETTALDRPLSLCRSWTVENRMPVPISLTVTTQGQPTTGVALGPVELADPELAPGGTTTVRLEVRFAAGSSPASLTSVLRGARTGSFGPDVSPLATNEAGIPLSEAIRLPTKDPQAAEPRVLLKASPVASESPGAAADPQAFPLPLHLPSIYYHLLAARPRPRLWFTSAEVRRLRQMKEDPRFAPAWAALREHVEYLEPPARVVRLGSGSAQPPRPAGVRPGMLMHLLTLDAAEPRGAMRGTARQLATAFAGDPCWASLRKANGVDLESADRSASVGLAFDTMRAELPAEQAGAMRDALIQKGVLPYLAALDYRRFPTADFGNNWCGVVTGGTGIGALALLGEDPRAAIWVHRIVQEACALMDALPSDGAWAEGPSYWSYTVSNLALFCEAVRRATDGTVNLFEHPFWRTTGRFLPYIWLPPGNWVNFGDCATPSISTSRGLLLKLAEEQKRPELAWLASQEWQMMPNDLWHAPLGGLGAAKAAAPPDLPASALFPDTGWAVMRSDWSRDAVVLALRSGGRTAHSHLDVNSFVLHAFGDTLVRDLPTPTPDYPAGYFARGGKAKFYWSSTPGHNTVSVAGESQTDDPRAAGRILAFLHGGAASGAAAQGTVSSAGADYVVSDASALYEGKLARALRHVVYLRQVDGPGSFLMVDEVNASPGAEVQWRAHCGPNATVRDGYASIVGQHGSLAIIPLSPARDQLSLGQHEGKERFVLSSAAAGGQEQGATSGRAAPVLFAHLLVPVPSTAMGGRQPIPQNLLPDVRTTTEGGRLKLQVSGRGQRDLITITPQDNRPASVSLCTEGGTGIVTRCGLFGGGTAERAGSRVLWGDAAAAVFWREGDDVVGRITPGLKDSTVWVRTAKAPASATKGAEWDATAGATRIRIPGSGRPRSAVECRLAGCGSLAAAQAGKPGG